jgi:hypothetical protein
MKNCWRDGDLRAYVDGELAPESRERLAAHLQVCPACDGRYGELAQRAAWVSAVMAGAEDAPAMPVARPRPRRWTLATIALAATLAIAFVMLPKRVPVHPAPPVAKVVVPPAPVAQTAPFGRGSLTLRTHTEPRPQGAVHREPPEEFLRLDDEPLETATIVRVSAEDGALQADLIVGPDGRAHAIRLVRIQ